MMRIRRGRPTPPKTTSRTWVDEHHHATQWSERVVHGVDAPQLASVVMVAKTRLADAEANLLAFHVPAARRGPVCAAL